jgi:hypothetical protein
MTFPIPDAALDDRLAFVGVSGSGKSYAASSAVERLLDRGARAVVIDPLGVLWGLRLRPDGMTPSPYNVPIFGGEHGDLPLTEHHGQIIGETVAGMAESCIIDLSQIGTKAGERRFMLHFLTALYRNVRGEQIHIVIDECDMFAPQRLMDKEGEAAKLLGMMETVVRRGRVKGFIPWLITQRPAVVSKDVLSQADGLIALKLTSSQDRSAIGSWIEGQADQQQGKAILASLPSMPRGNGVVWVPGRGVLETVAFPLKTTYDSSRAPKRGEKKHSTSLRPLDLGSLRDRLAQVEASTKENDPKALRAEVVRLKAKVANTSKPDASALNEAEHRGFLDGRATGDGEGFARGFVSGFKSAVQSGVDALEALHVPDEDEMRPEVPNLRRLTKTEHQAIHQPASATSPPGQKPVSPTVRKILDVIHRSYPVALTFQAAAMRAVVSKRSSAYRSYKKEVEGSEEIVVRDDGRLSSAHGGALTMGPDFDPVEEFSAKLPPSYAGMLRVIASRKSWLTREQIAESANVSVTSSGLGSGLRELKALALIVEQNGRYSLNPDLRGA